MMIQINKNILLLFSLVFYQFIIAQTPPVAEDDYDTAEINTALNVNAPGVLVNDTDSDNDQLSVTQFMVNGASYTVGQTASFTQGTITFNANGSFVFTPSTNYTGNVPEINYTISDGNFTSSANLFLTVERITNLLQVVSSTCNQSYTVENNYKIIYNITIRNLSTARDYHSSNLIKDISITNDLDAVFGNGCTTGLDDVFVNTTTPEDFVNNPYPTDFDDDAINPDFLNGTSSQVFTNNAINNFTLYPRQSINIRFCINVNPFCNGRPNPTPSGSGINFNNVFNITSSTNTATTTVSLRDFHTTEAIVTGSLHIAETNPTVNPDGTYDYINTVIITNEGTAIANNVNFNMGLGSFLDNNITFNQLDVTIVSPTSGVISNSSYDGNTNTELLAPNNSLAPGETIIIEIAYLTAPIFSSNNNTFNQLLISQTQGPSDGINETSITNKRIYSFVTWSDNLGNHLDSYYRASSPTQAISSTMFCSNCFTSSISFSSNYSSNSNKIISAVNESPNGVLEHQEITFQITVTNTSPVLQIENLQLQDNLTAICSGKILSISTPFIQNSTATTNPTINNSFNGTTDINLFNANEGLLLANESITVEFSVIFNEDCIGTNTANFSAFNALNNAVDSSASVNVSAFTDTDNDGITNFNDIDDDNDSILDIDEYNGINPLNDDDTDTIPNYRDTDFGVDANNDGVVDVFDFDNDGVPNHLDLDSDNDGILDIVEVGNSILDTNSNGTTNNNVGANGLDNTVENTDTTGTSITYTIPNTDGDNPNNPNFLDIDSDGDGIVDNIEAQTTDSYIASNTTVTISGINTAYPNGITPIDTENDTIFDYLDTNSDNDIYDDIIEGWDFNNDGVAETLASNTDTDNDGLDNAFDTDDALINPTNGQTPTDFPNVDNVDTSERDWREIVAIVIIIDNVSATEGNDLVFTVSLVKKNNNSILIQSTSSINIEFSTTNGTNTTDIYDVAISPFDYNAITNTSFIIPPNTTTAQFNILSLEDTIDELDELLTLNGTINSNNTINTQITGIGTIVDNDATPSITMNNSRADEGNDLTHIIELSNPSSRPTEIKINTNDNFAISPDDYTSVSTTLTINGTINPNNSNLQASFNIFTLTDNLNELDEETLNVIGTVTTTNIGTQDLTKTGTIVDIDPNPTVVIDNVTVVEGINLVFTIALLNSNSEPMQNHLPINFALETVNETATVVQDFEQITTNFSIPAYTSSITVSVKTFDDNLNEGKETMRLQATLFSKEVSNLSSIVFGTGTLKDNDIPNLFSPNGDGKSDTFKIGGVQDFPNFKIEIFDRWGGKVFSYSNNGNSNPIWWDGNYNGKPVIEGVYYYTLDFNDGITPPKTNFIQLIR